MDIGPHPFDDPGRPWRMPTSWFNLIKKYNQGCIHPIYGKICYSYKNIEESNKKADAMIRDALEKAGMLLPDVQERSS
jgi:hypothetical protein